MTPSSTLSLPMLRRTAEPIEPLFAPRERLWLRVWAATQGAAIVVGAYLTVERVGGLRALFAMPDAWRIVALFVAVVVYHVVGYRASGWILRRAWAVGLFVPLGWALVLGAARFGVGFALLIFGAVLQGFVFLPFAWAIAILTCVVGALCVAVAPRAGRAWDGLAVARVASLVATGIMIGTVMLYIHRANREAVVRARLLRQLDEAQRDLAARAREAGVQAERQRLAHELHDTLAQGFASVIQHLEATALALGDVPNAHPETLRARAHLGHAQAVSRASLAEIRRLVWALRPSPLAEAPLAAAVERIVAQWGAANGVATTCAVEPLPPLHPDADVVLLRATQESLSNVARHARAAHVAVTLQCVDGLVLLSVEDDGRGFASGDGAEEHASGAGSASDAGSAASGVGIAGMRARVRPFGGRVMIESAPGTGASVTVALPLAAAAAPSA